VLPVCPTCNGSPFGRSRPQCEGQAAAERLERAWRGAERTVVQLIPITLATTLTICAARSAMSFSLATVTALSLMAHAYARGFSRPCSVGTYVFMPCRETPDGACRRYRGRTPASVRQTGKPVRNKRVSLSPIRSAWRGNTNALSRWPGYRDSRAHS
jgi:hypothetical protein